MRRRTTDDGRETGGEIGGDGGGAGGEATAGRPGRAAQASMATVLRPPDIVHVCDLLFNNQKVWTCTD